VPSVENSTYELRSNPLRAKVLVVEDEREIGELIGMYLRKEGVETLLVESAEEAIDRLQHTNFDLLQELRHKSDIPVLIVSARNEDEDLILGLGIGADEFVTKPFSPKVLVARIRAHLRRTRKEQTTSQPKDVVRFGPFSLDIRGHILEKGRERIPLPPMEFELLKFLVIHPGDAMTPDQIYEAVWGQNYGDIATVSVHIRRLRKRIETNPTQPVYIETIHGAGYRFNPDRLGAEA